MAAKTLREIGPALQHSTGLNIWTCEVTGPRKSRRLHGHLVNIADTLLLESTSRQPLPITSTVTWRTDDQRIYEMRSATCITRQVANLLSSNLFGVTLNKIMDIQVDDLGNRDELNEV